MHAFGGGESSSATWLLIKTAGPTAIVMSALCQKRTLRSAANNRQSRMDADEFSPAVDAAASSGSRSNWFSVTHARQRWNG
jgi:hypothetical protein